MSPDIDRLLVQVVFLKNLAIRKDSECWVGKKKKRRKKSQSENGREGMKEEGKQIKSKKKTETSSLKCDLLVNVYNQLSKQNIIFRVHDSFHGLKSTIIMISSY